MGVIPISFHSEVYRGGCPCHSDKFKVLVFAIQPGTGESIEVGDSGWVDSEKEAIEKMASFTKETAFMVMREAGLDPDKILRVQETHGEEAEKATQRAKNANRHDLH